MSVEITVSGSGKKIVCDADLVAAIEKLQRVAANIKLDPWVEAPKDLSDLVCASEEEKLGAALMRDHIRACRVSALESIRTAATSALKTPAPEYKP